MENGLPTEVNKLLRTWKRQINKNEKLHRIRALRFRKIYYILGLPATILSALTTTGAIASIPSSSIMWLSISESIIGIIVTILVGTQTYLQLLTKFNDNKLASDRYQTLLRTIEMVLTTKNEGNPGNILNNIRGVFDDIVSTSPILPVQSKELNYSLFDRKNRTRSSRNLTCEESSVNEDDSSKDTDSEGSYILKERCEALEVLKPATIEELKNENDHDTDEEKDVCIDIDLDKQKKTFYPDPELQYQLDRFNDNNV